MQKMLKGKQESAAGGTPKDNLNAASKARAALSALDRNKAQEEKEIQAAREKKAMRTAAPKPSRRDFCGC